MISLASVVADHGSVLVLDAATAQVQAGLLRAGTPALWQAGGADSSVGLFAAAEAVLAAANLKPGALGAFVYCDGPGSQLGIRTACMALRTWQVLRPSPAPVFAYRSLRVAALAHAAAPPFAVIADARRGCWHAVRVAADGSASEVGRIPQEEVLAWPEPLFQPDGFRAWAPPPRSAGSCRYDCSALFAALGDRPMLHPVAEPQPWQSAPLAYQTWSGERHRGNVR